MLLIAEPVRAALQPTRKGPECRQPTGRMMYTPELGEQLGGILNGRSGDAPRQRRARDSLH
jgi:hypothetical protein